MVDKKIIYKSMWSKIIPANEMGVLVSFLFFFIFKDKA